MLEGLRGEDRIAELCRREGWSADEASKTLIVRNEGGLFSNQVGTEFETLRHCRRRSTENRNPAPASGISETVWKRGATVASQ